MNFVESVVMVLFSSLQKLCFIFRPVSYFVLQILLYSIIINVSLPIIIIIIIVASYDMQYRMWLIHSTSIKR